MSAVDHVNLKCQSCGSEYPLTTVQGSPPHRLLCYSCAYERDLEDYGLVSSIAHEAKPVRIVYAEIQDGDYINKEMETADAL